MGCGRLRAWASPWKVTASPAQQASRVAVARRDDMESSRRGRAGMARFRRECREAGPPFT